MGRDLRGRASFTRSTVTDTVARLSRPLDRLSLSLVILQATCTYMYVYTEYIYILSYPPRRVHHAFIVARDTKVDNDYAR